MRINLEFNSFEEMKNFVSELKLEEVRSSGTVQSTPTQSAPTTQSVPVSPVVSVVPVATVAPVASAQSSAPVQQSSPAATVPTSQKTYSLDDLARAAISLMDSGRQADLRAILEQFGVEALPALPPEKYGAFATTLRGLGAQI